MLFVVVNFWGMACLQALIATTGHAEIVLHGTRVIYPSDAREVNLQLSNNGTAPSWFKLGLMMETLNQLPMKRMSLLSLHHLFQE